MPDSLITGFAELIVSDNGQLLKKLAEEGQEPDCLIISCMDSRCNPAAVFQTRLGKFFAHAPMGAIVPDPEIHEGPSELKAKLKFAVDYNESVKHIIVLGHTRCGAMNALVNDLDDEDITPWTSVARGAFEKARHLVGDGDQTLLQRETEKQAVIQSVENLLLHSVVGKAVGEGRLEVHGWLLAMKRGALMELDQSTGQFSDIDLVHHMMGDQAVELRR